MVSLSLEDSVSTTFVVVSQCGAMAPHLFPPFSQVHLSSPFSLKSCFLSSPFSPPQHSPFLPVSQSSLVSRFSQVQPFSLKSCPCTLDSTLPFHLTSQHSSILVYLLFFILFFYLSSWCAVVPSWRQTPTSSARALPAAVCLRLRLPRSLPCHSSTPRLVPHTRSHTHSHSSLSP